MAKRSGGGSAGPRALIARLGATVSALPSEAEKREAQANLTALIEFLTDIRQKLQTLPSLEEVSEIKRAADVLEALFAKAERDPVLGSVLGMRRQPAVRRSRSPVTSEDQAKARTALETLRTLPSDEIRSNLLNPDRHSSNVLRAMAAEMGLRPTEKMGREALAQQIVTRIVNDRGYRALRGEDEAIPSDAA